jgi:hypothetical protein
MFRNVSGGSVIDWLSTGIETDCDVVAVIAHLPDPCCDGPPSA